MSGPPDDPKPPTEIASTLGAGSCPLPIVPHERVVLGHGSGGRLTGELIERLFLPLLDDPHLRAGDDAAVLDGLRLADGSGLAISTDAHVVKPLFFPGGDIGRLAACGTINDLAMVGARPVALAVAFIIEEGFPTEDLARAVRSLKEAADEAGVAVVTGDTKVAERGHVDGLYITTTGVGLVPAGRRARADGLRPGDAVLLSGPIGDHGIAVLAARGGLSFETTVRSDTAPLAGLVEAMHETGAPIHALRDPTRGGLAASLNELATSSKVSVALEEEAIPVRTEVRAACEMLGFDPLHVANEGKLVAFVPEDDADRVLQAMRAHEHGREAQRIGRVQERPAGRVLLKTLIGGTRVVDVPAGELLPRIC